MALNAESFFEQIAFPGGSTNIAVGGVLASAATIAPTYAVHHVSGTVAIATITPPWTGFTGYITLIPDGAWSFTSGGNIASASQGYQATVGVPVEVQFDGTSWYISGGGGSITYFEPMPLAGASIAPNALGAGTFAVVPFTLPAPARFQSVNALLAGNLSATNAGSSIAETLNHWIGVYSRTGSTLSAISTNSATTAYTVTGSSSSASYHGLKNLQYAMALNLPAGNYWYAVGLATSTAGNAVGAGLSHANLSAAGSGSVFRGVLGATTNASNCIRLGGGLMSAAQTIAPASIALSDIQGSTPQNVLGNPIVVFYNATV